MKKSKSSDAGLSTSLLRRYVLTGAAIGLYFGYFFRPLREPSLALVIGLSLLAAVATVGLQAVRKRPPVSILLKDALATWVKYALLLAALEGRHWAYVMGGKAAVVVLTTLAGALMGAWLAYEKRET